MNRPLSSPEVSKGVTRIIRPENDGDLAFPAALLACGELVAFPTETVYGLGADAKDAQAVAKIFAAKGRPSDNPLIVHVARKSDIKDLVLEITPLAQCLMDAFMPGPVTLVMKKSDRIPGVVSAGLKTVGIRMPSHPVAQKLILMSGVAVAAPSANVSGSPSPTRAEHVLKDLEGKIPCIVDGGPCEVGLESSVVDVTGTIPVILRPGAVTIEMIRKACREAGIPMPENANGQHFNIDDSADSGNGGGTPRAPGMKYRHYAPRAQLSVVMPETGASVKDSFGFVAGESSHTAGFMAKCVKALSAKSKDTIGVFCGRSVCEALKEQLPAESLSRVIFYVFGEDGDIEEAARGLFDGIRYLDTAGVGHIFAAGFTGDGLQMAYMNRLKKASGEKKELDPRDVSAVQAARNVSAVQAVRDVSAVQAARNVLFVCTGNTCRSPMAEAIFNHLAQRRGPFCRINDGKTVVQLCVSSGGVFAENKSPAAAYASDTVRFLFGADLSGHQSQKVTAAILSDNDLVIAVTQEHALILRRLFPAFSDKIYSFSEYFSKKSIEMPGGGAHANAFDIPDPFGQSRSVYDKTARCLYDLIDAMWETVLLDLGIARAVK